jgi:hypothetical protein
VLRVGLGADTTSSIPVAVDNGATGHTVDIQRSKRPALLELSPANSKRTNVLVSEATQVIPLQVSPNADENSSKFPGLYYRNYLPIHDREHCFRSQVYWRWRQKDSIKLDKEFYRVVNDDMHKSKSSGRKSDGISLDLLATLLWGLLSFLYPKRRGKKKAKALLDCIFTILALKFPEYFDDALMESSRKYCRSWVTIAYKLQRTIDTQPTGGLNLSCIEA